MITRLSLLFLITATPSLAAGPFYNIRDFGARGDGQTVNTQSIQRAIDACHDTGGGTVYVPAGRYLSGTVVLKDNITLFLDAGAVLLGSTDIGDYPAHIPDFRSYNDGRLNKSLIYAEKATGVAILGRGTIDGQGEEEAFFQYRKDPYSKMRPAVIQMVECRNITVRDIKIMHAAMWVQHYLACENLNIDGITVRSAGINWNNDGIDIDCCNRVRISNCDIYTSDDAIVLKSTGPRVCENVTVSNCVLRSNCSAFKCGTESTGGFRNIVVSNCAVYNTRRSGIALQLVDGGIMDRIIVSGITMDSVACAVFIRLGNRARPYLIEELRDRYRSLIDADDTILNPGVGSLQNVSISDIIATGVGPVGCSITGIPGHDVENINLSNIQLRFAGGGTEDLVNRDVPEMVERGPEYNMFGTLPAYGFYCRHAKNLHFRDLDLDYDTPEARPACVFEDIDGLRLRGIQVKDPAGDAAPFIFHNVINMQEE